ncbi:alpha/beta fold hydrolase [Frigoribacterium sp. VKM Ac-2530]|uniref:alpha/beta fold hydrolase n=1 Tax=Frigoribacterium sp. VKM Ac-2530 TaxID=2783822 RepID=UPI00188DC40F|nr:alpha/beta hydrolase [Frigoribacterium sp. VKM Ac-2530]MBF4579569.1 alpha/beta hydrolase [Frigoribacterium sp. VKM Ac-2530]
MGTAGTFVSADGVTLAYTDSGEAPVATGRTDAAAASPTTTASRTTASRTVVLVAGYAMPAAAWALQTDALLAAGHRVVEFDRRSHGASEDVLHGQRIARHGADLHELLVHLDLHDVVLVGQSMGASTVWAAIDLFGTDRIAGVLTIDQTPKLVNDAGWSHGFYGMTPENSGTFFDDGIPDTGRGARVDPSNTGVARLFERLGGPPAVREANAPETRKLLRDHGLQDWRDVIARLDVPFTMVAGRDSQLWPCSHAEAAVGGHALGRSVVIDDAGHATNFDRPDEFNGVLLAFVAGL